MFSSAPTTQTSSSSLMSASSNSPSVPTQSLQQKQSNASLKKASQVSWQNLAIGATMQLFEVSTLGQPFDVLKTHMAANRQDSFRQAIVKTWQRRGGSIRGFYQGLVPWAWIEASTKGAVLLFVSGESERMLMEGVMPTSPLLASTLGGMIGGVAQAYTTMGFCTFMKTVEVTRQKSPQGGGPSTLQVAREVFQREGIRGMNRGVSAVALRQMTNWGSRFGISRLTESALMKMRSEEQQKAGLTVTDKLLSSMLGGFLGCWNQPFEVIRVEMQSQLKGSSSATASSTGGKKPSMSQTARFIWQRDGFKGFYRGVTPRICLSVYLTVCMVFGGDQLKARLSHK